MKPGYWATHEYERESVMNLPGFCGWKTLMLLVKAADLTQYRTSQNEILRQRDQALVCLLFQTGGRIQEVMQLRKGNFKIYEDKILVSGMPVVKRYKKVRSWVEKRKDLPTRIVDGKPNSLAGLYLFDEKHKCYSRKRWETEPFPLKRMDFTIWKQEPLSTVTTDWIEQSSDYLFPAYLRSKQPFLAPARAYTILKGIENNFNGLVNEGAADLEQVKLYPHWFRSMRASQLHKEYRYDEFRLKRFFAWESSKMAYHYAHVDVEELEETWKATEDMEKARSLL
jgi:integrase